MFAKDKGVIENRLPKLDFKSFHAFRPSYIYPVTPWQEPNFSYHAMRLLYPLIKLLGSSYSIRSTELAQAMFSVGLNMTLRAIWKPPCRCVCDDRPSRAIPGQ